MVKRLRLGLRLTQEELAGQLRVSKLTIGNVERTGSLSLATARKLETWIHAHERKGR